MTASEARLLYLAWVRTKYPSQYVGALRAITGKPRSLGGLGDDLLMNTISSDVSQPTDSTLIPGDILTTLEQGAPTSFSVVPAGSYSQSPLNALTADQLTPIPAPTVESPSWGSTISAPSSTAPSWFSTFTNAVANVATTYLNTSAQGNLLSLNTQRARQGLPPVNAQGVPVTSAGLMPANSRVYAIERTIAGATSSPMLWLGLAAIAGIFLFSKRAA